MPPPCEQCADGSGEQEAGGGDRAPRRERPARMRVEDGEARRPERVCDVGRVRGERVADPEGPLAIRESHRTAPSFRVGVLPDSEVNRPRRWQLQPKALSAQQPATSRSTAGMERAPPGASLWHYRT